MAANTGGSTGSLWRMLITAVSNGVTGLNNLTQTIAKTFPAWSGASATTATAGAASALPATPAGYAVIVNPTNGQTVKIPYYLP